MHRRSTRGNLRVPCQHTSFATLRLSRRREPDSSSLVRNYLQGPPRRQRVLGRTQAGEEKFVKRSDTLAPSRKSSHPLFMWVVGTPEVKPPASWHGGRGRGRRGQRRGRLRK